MSAKRFGCVGVVAPDGRLIGIITDGDIRRHIDGVLGRSAGEVMTKTPRVATRDYAGGGSHEADRRRDRSLRG